MHEENAFRFELVAIDLCSAAEGYQFVPTSRTRDLGRDVWRVSSGSREVPAVVCATRSVRILTSRGRKIFAGWQVRRGLTPSCTVQHSRLRMRPPTT